MPVVPRSFFSRPSQDVAPDLLGCLLARDSAEGRRVMRITEVEAYAGPLDPASHGYKGKTPRNAVMFGPPGFLYVYFTYGMHFCINFVCSPEDECSAVLIRAGEIVEGIDLARAARSGASDRDLARGPARLTKALGLARDDNGLDLCDGGPLTVLARESSDFTVATGPRVGVSSAAEIPWRFWIEGDRTVSAYKAHKPKARSSATSS
ncbi:DNA-3-methyladenine glycosylase [Catenulispora sp. NL8]|uniref:Putative 3-methyladenine DNA glycosylase n=1 Tax=Catenulispora pinistramenti TaxID=2705254 RepID=A0ABS5L1H7_9ACTN|nr:DNA-3-methyladenine glycosylase [Catenulispora pinistramenti]MBS2552000.1 DNA-3-methyladenine glycosylase [Catenulispora pinistramenti]